MEPVFSEQYLLQRVAEGDGKAFETLYLAYRPELASFLFRLSKSAELAEEIVQDVFVKIWTHREKLGGVHSFRSYLFVAARHHALNALRKSVSERARLLSLQQEAVQLQDDNQESDLYAQLDEAINRLPPQQKAVYLLCRQEGLAHKEIAGRLGLSTHTVKKYMKLAVVSIKNYLLQKRKSKSLDLFFLFWILS